VHLNPLCHPSGLSNANDVLCTNERLFATKSHLMFPSGNCCTNLLQWFFLAKRKKQRFSNGSAKTGILTTRSARCGLSDANRWYPLLVKTCPGPFLAGLPGLPLLVAESFRRGEGSRKEQGCTCQYVIVRIPALGAFQYDERPRRVACRLHQALRLLSKQCLD
jgi:hypothetical protein